MAEGRMLTRRVSRSTKLADLSSDTARMIYSWLIPYTDVEGRMEADPRLLKADIAPLLDHITPEVINNVLLDCARVGLIILYTGKHDGKAYLQVTKFEANQKNLRKDREAPSQIPGPEPDQLQTNSGATPEQLGYKRREEKYKLRESTKALPTEEQPVDNSSHEQKTPDSLKTKKGPLQSVNGRWTEQLRNDLEEIVTEIRDRYGPNYHQQCVIAVQTHLAHVNPEAMIYCLRELIQQNLKGNKIARPKEWLNKAIHNQDGKINAAESEAEAQQFKAPLAPAAIGVLDRLGMSGFGVKPVRE